MATYVGVGALVLGALLSAYGTYASAQNSAAQAQAAAAGAQRQAEYQRELGQYAVANFEAQAAQTRALGAAQAQQYEQQARAAQVAGDLKVQDTYNAGERLQSTARASIAKSGVDTTGSPLELLLENAAAVEEEAERLRYATAVDVASAKSGAVFARGQAELDAQGIERESVMRKFGFDIAGAGYGAEASMQFSNAGMFRRAGALGAGGSLLAAGGSLAFRYPQVFGG